MSDWRENEARASSDVLWGFLCSLTWWALLFLGGWYARGCT